MKVENVVPKPYEKSILPSLRFDVEIIYSMFQEAIISVNGLLETNDGKIIAEVNEALLEKTYPSYQIGARGSGYDANFREDTYKTVLVALLDVRALNHIEQRRNVDKGDVKLTLVLNVKFAQNNAKISPVHEINPKEIKLEPIEIPIAGPRKTHNWFLLAYAEDEKFSSSRPNRWLLSGGGNPVYLIIKEQTSKKEIRIHSSEWIQEYAPILGLGEYFIVEIPKGEKTVQEAWSLIDKAEKSYRQWITKGVYAHCREVGYLLDGVVKKKFGKDDFNYKERWGRSYGRFENFASLDLHLEDIKKSKQYPEDVEIRKADAEHILIVTKALIKYAEELLQEASK